MCFYVKKSVFPLSAKFSFCTGILKLASVTFQAIIAVTILSEVEALIERWRKEYNWKQPHSARNSRSPAPVAFLTMVAT
jgi:hypothetical protein